MITRIPQQQEILGSGDWHKHSRTPRIRINWDDETFGNAENPKKLDFSLQIVYIFCLFSARKPPSGPWPHNSRDFQITNNDATHSAWLLCTSDQLVPETSTCQHKQHSQQTDVHNLGGIQTNNLSRRAAVDLSLRPRGHWDRQK